MNNQEEKNLPTKKKAYASKPFYGDTKKAQFDCSFAQRISIEIKEER